MKKKVKIGLIICVLVAITMIGMLLFNIVASVILLLAMCVIGVIGVLKVYSNDKLIEEE